VKSVVNRNEASPVTYNGANRQLNVQHSEFLLRKIRTTIRQFPGHGYPRTEQVAKKVGITQRTLQRRLAAAGTSHLQLVQKLRFDLITKLLKDPHESMATIGSKAGFARPSGFSRAVKNWTGMSPSQYRSQLLARSVPGTRKSKQRKTSGRRGKTKSVEPSSRDTYKYNFEVGNKIVHRGITIDLERRETEHQRRWPNGHIKQVGHRSTADAARKWKETK
jgi:AraC-like DNA-binding protein